MTRKMVKNYGVIREQDTTSQWMLHIERLLLKDEIRNNTDTWYYQTKEIDIGEILLDDSFLGFESIGEMLFHI